MPGLWQTARDAWSVGPVAAAATSANASCLWVRVGILLGSSNTLWLEESQSHMRSVSSVPGPLLLGVGSMLLCQHCSGWAVCQQGVRGSEKMLVGMSSGVLQQNIAFICVDCTVAICFENDRKFLPN